MKNFAMKYIFVLLLLGGSTTMLADQSSKQIKVSSSGKVSLPATIAQVEVGIKIIKDQAGTVQQELDKQNNALVAFLRKQEISDLQTVTYQIQAKTNFVNGKREDKGFEGIVVLSFHTLLKNVGKIIDQVGKHGANEVRSINFTAKPAEMEKAEKKALALASEAALQKGQHVLNSLSLKYTGIAKVFVGYQDMGPQIHKRLASFAESSGPSLEAGNVQVEAQVTLVLDYQ